jgi:stage V sporulation protein B
VGRKVLRGAAILLVAGVVARVLGFFYRIFLARQIGPQGMGLIAMSYPLMGMALNLAGAGLPVALAKVVAERLALPGRSIRHVLPFAMTFVLLSGVGLSAALVLAAPWLSRHALTDPRAYLPLVALTPQLLIIPAAMVLRGYFQGRQTMFPLAVATVLEQATRIAAVIFLVPFFLPYGLGWAAVGATVAMTLGELTGLATLAAVYRLPRLLDRSRPPPAPPQDPRDRLGATGVELLRLGLPVTGYRLVGSFTDIGDAVVVPRRLEVAGMTRDQATAFYGNLSAMALPLLFFPTVLTVALSTALMPAISEADARSGTEGVRARTERALHFTLLLALPASAVFVALGHSLGVVIYGQRAVGDLLVPLALAAPCLYVDTTLQAVLRGLGRPAIPMLNGLLGSLTRLALIYVVTAVSHAGVLAVVLGIAVDMAVTMSLDLAVVARLVRPRVDLWRALVLPGACAAAMVAACRLGLGLSGLGSDSPWSVAMALVLGLAVYVAGVWTTGSLRGVVV